MLAPLLPWADVAWLRATWERIVGWTGDYHLHVDAKRIYNARGAGYYCAKYMAKVERTAAVGGVPQAPAGGPPLDSFTLVNHDGGPDDPRFGARWYMWNEDLWPYAKARSTTLGVTAPSSEWFWRLKEVHSRLVEARCRKRGVEWRPDGYSCSPLVGFKAYSNGPAWDEVFAWALTDGHGDPLLHSPLSDGLEPFLWGASDAAEVSPAAALSEWADDGDPFAGSIWA